MIIRTTIAAAMVAASIPIGAHRVQMLTVTLTAPCERDAILHSLRLSHRGLGNPSDIDRVYAMVGNARKTRGFTPASSDGTVTLQFRRYPIPRCTSVTFAIVADFSETASVSGQHAFELWSTADVQSSVPLRIGTNATGPTPTTTTAGQAAATVTVELLDLPRPLTWGDRRTVSRLRLRGDARRDQIISAITFVNDGSARDADLQNLTLETSGHARLSDPLPRMDGDRVRIELDPPLRLRRNEIRLVQLVADIRASRRRTVRFLIQEPSDVEAQSTR